MHIELGQVADRLGDADAGIGLCLVAGRLIVLLATDCSPGKQVRGPLVFRGQALEVGLRLDDVGLGTSQLGLVRTGIDLKQHVPLLDIGSFLEQHLFQVTTDPGPHVDGVHGLHASGKIFVVPHLAPDRVAHLDLGRPRWGRRCLGTFAAGQDQAGQQREAQAGVKELCHLTVPLSFFLRMGRSASLRMPWKTTSRISCACSSGGFCCPAK